jgi:hypothetical protein
MPEIASNTFTFIGLVENVISVASAAAVTVKIMIYNSFSIADPGST